MSVYSESQSDVQLGFVAETLPKDALTAFTQPLRDWDAAQLGGCAPAFHDQATIPASKVKCGVCDRAMVCLASVYAPIDEEDVSHPHSYYRMLHVFSCRNGKCTNHASAPGSNHPSFCVLRAQSSKKEGIQPSSLVDRTCGVCGLAGEQRCSRCKSITYCSREHQALHWTNGHKEECDKADASTCRGSAGECGRRAGLILRCARVEIEEEAEYLPAPAPAPPASGGAARGQAQLDEQDTEPSIEGLTQAELSDTTGTGHAARDPVLHHFLRRAGHAQGQVIRYCRWPPQEGEAEASTAEEADEDDEDGTFCSAPLWFTRSHRPDARVGGDVPPCTRCGAPRAFELQLMPQLLAYVGNDAFAAALGDSSFTGMEWGTLAVYTCTASCHVASTHPEQGQGPGQGQGDAALPSALCQEFVWVQPSATGEEEAAARAAAALQLHYLHEGPPEGHQGHEEGEAEEGLAPLQEGEGGQGEEDMPAADKTQR